MIEGVFSCIGGMVGVTIGILWFMPFRDASLEHINEWQKNRLNHLVEIMLDSYPEVTGMKKDNIINITEDLIAALEEKGFDYVYASRVGREGETVLTERDEILKLRDYMSLIIANRIS